MKRFFIKSVRENKGTTLIETLLALSIFSIFITVAIGGFVQSLSNQRLVLRLMSSTDAMVFSLEQMIREMRTGTNFAVGNNNLQFERADEEFGLPTTKLVRYEWDNSRKILIRTKSNLDGGSAVSEPITPEDVEVSHFSAEAFREHTPGPYRITVVIGISASEKKTVITNYVQTTISSRVF